MYRLAIIQLILCAMGSLGISNTQNTTLLDRIPIYLQELCPGRDVCLNNVIDTHDNTLSCCGACSCTDDCVVKGNCCFPNQTSISVDNVIPRTSKNSECLHPVTKRSPSVTWSYKMITSSQKDKSDYMISNKSVTCGDTKVAPWGSLYPTYSKTTGEIYKNSVCANAYNVSDGEEWTAYLSCESLGGFVPGIDTGFMPEDCLVMFEYPGERTLLNSEVCYHADELQSTCIPGLEFHIPPSTSASREDIVVACESDLISPFNSFSNVFCSMCRSRPGSNALKCSRGEDAARKLAGYDSIAIAIEGSETINEVGNNGNPNMACLDHSHQQTMNTNGAACRPIICPFGQILDQDQECIYIGRRWIVNKLNVYLRLFSSHHFDISPLLRDVANLESPWPKSWTLDLITYAKSMQAMHISVMLSKTFDSAIDPKAFFKRLRTYLDKPWSFISDNETITLHAEFSNFKSTHSEKFHSSTALSGLRRFSGIARIEAFVTTLAFCNHVTLSPSEFSISKDSYRTAFNKITNTTLYDGEFIMVNSQTGTVLKVCIEKSGLYKIPSKNSTNVQMSSDSERIVSHNCILCFMLILVGQCLFLMSCALPKYA